MLASELVDPHVFEICLILMMKCFHCQTFMKTLNFSSYKLLDLLFSKSNLPWNIIIDCAKTVNNLFILDKALKIIKFIISSIKNKATQFQTNSLTEELNVLKNILFLPILSKLKAYILPWKGEGHHLLSPSQVISSNLNEYVKGWSNLSSQKAILIINTNYVHLRG